MVPVLPCEVVWFGRLDEEKVLRGPFAREAVRPGADRLDSGCGSRVTKFDFNVTASTRSSSKRCGCRSGPGRPTGLSRLAAGVHHTSGKFHLRWGERCLVSIYIVTALSQTILIIHRLPS